MTHVMCNQRNLVRPRNIIANWDVRIRIHKKMMKEAHISQAEGRGRPMAIDGGSWAS